MSKLQLKWAGVLGLCVLALFLLYPSVNWYTLDPADRAEREAQRDRPRILLNLGLDLKGGSHLLMELDVSKLEPGADHADAMNRAIEVIRNRVDQFGVAEPLIARQGKKWIVVQMPGITNSAQAKDLIGKTALLEFRMVNDSEQAQNALNKILELGNPFGPENSISTAAAKLVPAGTQLFPGKDGAIYLLSSSAALTGAQLESARVETGGQYGMPHVGFRFKPEAATIFANLTGNNVNKNLAIVLDGVVYSAPVIKSRISGGQGIIEGNFSIDEARGLAIVLRAGALPAPVRIIEERTIGPSLGEDSIRSGLWAIGIATAFIFVFMLFYYRIAGLVADLALSLNIVFLLAAMAYFGATLTLPGIAGIILTLAMAVDANVLIFERIKEELGAGKPTRIALSAGYEKAMSAILDSNLTTFISAVFLFQFGTGPIKGFAVTLVVGLLVSLFTAIVLTRLIFESYLSGGQVETLSI